MKKIIFLIPLLALAACDDFDPWGKASKGLCDRYGNNCQPLCTQYGNCDAKSDPVKSCDLYGNCGD